MTCDEVERDEVTEQYLLRQLPEADEAAFEAHYFECPRCLARLRALEELRDELVREERSGGRVRWLPRVGAALAAAAVLVLAVRVAQDQRTVDPVTPAAQRGQDIDLPPARPASTPAEALLARLGTIEPPPYTPPRLRAAPTEAQRVFRTAMESYTAGDCSSATPGLARAVSLDTSFVQAHFFLAICHLQSGRTADAVPHLERVIALGESAYLEDAHFYLAKARIRQGDIERARRELTRVTALDGERRDEAARLLRELPQP